MGSLVRVLVLAALAPVAAGHGGIHRGPGDTVPPGAHGWRDTPATAPEMADRIRAMHAGLDRQRENDQALRRLHMGQQEEGVVELTPEAKERLRALGYLH